MKLVIGSRGSALALWQANWARRKLASAYPDFSIEIEVIKTEGDRLSETPVSQIGGKEVWTKEIEHALLSGSIDLAVHSLKDLPTRLPEGLVLGAVSAREDVRDVLVSKNDRVFRDLPEGATVATGSLRRQAQLKHARPDLNFVAIRGNVDTRVKKLETENLDGIILAAAGLKRLGLGDRIADFIDPEICLPAPGQAALGIEIREGDQRITELVGVLNCVETQQAVTAERTMLAALGGDCRVPIGGYAAFDKASIDVLLLSGVVASPDGRQVISERAEGQAPSAEQLGVRVAKGLIKQGAGVILDRDGKDTLPRH
ncbi:MAG: hydroxymethylbilane synthase [Gemmatimonadetes bacterium]|nr:hydroxymethylbilane synthase [Gemmatimonadota bacterium]MYD60727.1 hydroxymethylbilane synthase [Gemmatimonadota bacterium]MYF75063.1 hydroxymethylbilane synthase [Gemmatimonadota bacterium]MYK52796.1 hydroxymethylbilane synthase [Gemmatimonadota bacterium]